MADTQIPDLASIFDHVDPQRLHERGSAKWAAGPDMIGVGVAEMDFDPPIEVTETVHQRVRLGDLGLSHPRAVDAIVSSFCEWASDRWEWSVDRSLVVPVGDVMRVLDFCIQHATDPGAGVVVPTPAFPAFLSVPRDWGRPVLETPMVREAGRWSLDLEHLEHCFRAGGRLMILCNPHNPLGSFCSLGEMRDLAELVDKYNAVVFADEIHAPLVYRGGRSPAGERNFVPYASSSAAAGRHTITGTSAAKGWNIGGMKAALMVLPKGERNPWASTSMVLSHGASTLGMWATAAAFRDARPWLDATLDYLDRSRHLLDELVAEHLPGVRYRVPESTYLAWLDFRDVPVGEAPSQFMRERAHVLLDDGRSYGAAGQGHIRLNFATSHELLSKAVSSMGAALATA